MIFRVSGVDVLLRYPVRDAAVFFCPDCLVQGGRWIPLSHIGDGWGEDNLKGCQLFFTDFQKKA